MGSSHLNFCWVGATYNISAVVATALVAVYVRSALRSGTGRGSSAGGRGGRGGGGLGLGLGLGDLYDLLVHSNLDGATSSILLRPNRARVSCFASYAFSVQNSGKIRTANIDLANTEGVSAKVYFPNPRIVTASPFSVGIFLKVLAFDFRSKGVFRRSWLLWLRMRKVGRHDHSKTSSDQISFK